MRVAVPLLTLLAGLSGCTSLADVSSGQIGCPPEQIAISDDAQTWGARTWKAECNGQTFTCSAHGGGENSTAQVSCTPMAGSVVPGGSDAAPPEPTEQGCQYDTQCKGERICRAGECVDPAPPAAGVPAAPPVATEPSAGAPQP
jgi:hypothetical protein